MLMVKRDSLPPGLSVSGPEPLINRLSGPDAISIQLAHHTLTRHMFGGEPSARVGPQPDRAGPQM